MKNSFSKGIVCALTLSMLAPSLLAAQNYGANLPSDLPPTSAKPGQCYARVLVPAVYRNAPMEVVTQEAVERIDVAEPTFRSRPETVLTREGYTRYVVTEPTFRTEQATIVTRPAYERLVVQPAQMASRTETVTIREPRMVWRQGSNLSGIRRLDTNTGEIYCLVEERGVTQTIARKVVTAPARVSRVMVPAQTETLTRQVVATPASVREVNVAPETRTIHIQELANPAAERRVMVPEGRSTINRQILVTPERYEWAQVECDHSGASSMNVPMKPAHPMAAPTQEPRGVPVQFNNSSQMGAPITISTRQLQTALAQKGFYRGPIDGIYGPLTKNAVGAFQRSNNMAVTGRVNAEMVRALGLGR